VARYLPQPEQRRVADEIDEGLMHLHGCQA
jgi:hypothetical protein